MKCWCGGMVVRDICIDSEFHDPHATGRREHHTKLYIAGPMTGIPDCNYPAFNEAEKRLTDAGYTVLNPATAHSGKNHYVDMLRTDLQIMLDCHGVAVLDRWWESTGARNEVNNAGVLLMPVRTVDSWLERAVFELA